jgi:SAM-dependent methyltransferase
MIQAINRFNAAAHNYAKADEVQCYVARQLGMLMPSLAVEPDKRYHVLELGAGPTANFTKQLLAGANHRNVTLYVTDPAKEMLALNQLALQGQPKNAFIYNVQLRSEQLDRLPYHFNRIGHTFVAHWLNNPVQEIERQRQKLTPDGWLFYAAPTADNFAEWNEHLASRRLDTPRRDDLPSVWPGQFKTEEIARDYGSAHGFLRMLTQTGANTPKKGYRPPDRRSFAKACESFDGKVTWKIAYCALKC